MTRSLAPVLLSALLLLAGSGRGGGEPAISPSWKPIVPVQLSTRIVHRGPGALSPSYVADSTPASVQQQLRDASHDQCALYKVVMSQQLYFEYIHYKIDVPDLKEFTLCMWTKFTNHTNDHPLFSYAVGNQPRSILSWVANTPRSSYYMMNIDGHNLYRLNYPLRLNRWYHSCQSWNGRTGEWQIWVNDERVGRGFNNRLVGHVIKGGGVAISGQEQRQLGGGFLEGEGAPAGSGGMLGELTMVQLYGVALTAGKAHRDHKHHHAHHFEHDTSNNVPLTTTTQAPITGPPLPMNPYLTGGQLNHQVKINPGAHIQIVQNGLTLRHPALPAPSEAPQPLPPAILTSPSLSAPTLPTSILTSGAPINGFSFVDRRYRELSADSKRKRALVYAGGTLVDDSYVQPASQLLTETGYLTGLTNFGQVMTRPTDSTNSELEAEVDAEAGAEGQQEVEREPAEEEVRRVMDMCDGCVEEPFGRALVMGWRNVPKKLYSGALHVPALPVCKAF